MPKLTSEGEGSLKFEDTSVPAWQLLCESELTDWPEANLKEVIRYLYGNKYLELPIEWKRAFPTHI